MKNVDIQSASTLKLITLFTDILIVNFCSLFIFLLEHPLSFSFFSTKFLLFTCATNIAWLVCAWFFKLYKTTTFFETENVYRFTLRAVVLYNVLFYIALFANKFIEHNFIKVIIFYSISISVLFTVSRFFITYISGKILSLPAFQRKVVIVGYNEVGLRIARYLKSKGNIYSFSGFFDDYSSYGINKKGEIVGSIDNCVEYALDHNVTDIYSTLNPEGNKKVENLIDDAEKHCVRIRFVGDAKPFAIQGSSAINFIEAYPIVGLRKDPLEYMGKRMKKRFLDVLISSFVTLFILSWLMPLVAILIKLESKGPVFYSQKRNGRNNKPFTIWKFRTMYNSDKEREFKQAVKDDPRITRVGKFLRKTSIDEFPQFLNVLFGSMSFAGPRPHPIKLNEDFCDSIHSYMARHFVKPGISGWAQVCGYRGETESLDIMKKRIEHDIWYIENWSFMLDVKIFFLTIINILRGEARAY